VKTRSSFESLSSPLWAGADFDASNEDTVRELIRQLSWFVNAMLVPRNCPR
jgi:hypothetical protein